MVGILRERYRSDVDLSSYVFPKMHNRKGNRILMKTFESALKNLGFVTSDFMTFDTPLQLD